MAELVDILLGDADSLHGRELAYLALLVSDRMRGGRVGDDLAAPEVFAAAVRDALGR